MKLVWQRSLFVKNRGRLLDILRGGTLVIVSPFFVSSRERMFARCEKIPTFVGSLHFLKGENLGYQIYFLLPNSND